MPALYTSIQAVLSLYASGRTTGIVLDAGDGVSHAVPVYEGFAITNSIQRIDVAGRDITEYLQTLLRKSGYVFHTSAEKEVVRHIKEAVTYVAHDPRKEEKDWAQVKLDQNKVVEYTLPDGNKLKVRFYGIGAPVARKAWCCAWGLIFLCMYRLEPSASEHRRSSLTPRSLVSNTRVCTRLLLIPSTGRILTYGKHCMRTLCYLAAVRLPRALVTVS